MANLKLSIIAYVKLFALFYLNKGSVHFTGDILAATDRLELLLAVEDSVSWHDAIQRKRLFCLSRKRCPARGVTVRCYGCYANGFRFDSHLADFHFVFFLYFFQAPLRCYV